MKSTCQSLLTLLCIFLILESPVIGQKVKKEKDKTIVAAKDSSATKKDTTKKETLADKVKASKKIIGLFTLYQDTVSGSVMIFIQKPQLKKEFLYQSFSMGGPPSLFLNQNMLRETWLFSIRKNFDKLYWVRSNTSFYYDPSNAISKSANVDVSETVFYVEKIISEDSTGYLINADNLFLSEKLDPIKPFIPPTIPSSAYLNLGGLVKDKSEYFKLRSFPKNTDIVVNLSYENGNPQNFGGMDIADARYINVKMQHSLIELPENDFIPRADHPHIGYFTVQSDDMSSKDINYYRDFIYRWHLKKKNPDQALSEPVEPITWWIENTTPVELRQVIMDAGNKWNSAFEKAGFKNAVVMKIMPDNADWDPADIRYNVIRWVSSNLGYAIGPCFVNPRTGQILGSDITIDYSFLRFAKVETQAYELGHPIEPHYDNGIHQCSMGKGLTQQQQFAHAYLDALDADEEEKKELLHQFITELVLHEMGHTMGLNHNMKSSHMLSPTELKDKSMTGKYGVTGSVMDYSMVNIALDKSQQAHFYTTVTGPYDHWAIEYGYTPFKPENEKAGLEAIVKRSTDPKLIFGNDADICFPGAGIDPRVMVWDLSSDPIAYGEERFKIVEKGMANLKNRFIKPNESYEKFRNYFYFMFYQRFNMARTVAGYVGGVYVDRSMPGQNSKNLPFTPVSEVEQRKAVQLISQYVFSPTSLKDDQYLYNYLQMQRRGFGFSGFSEDPKLDGLANNMYLNVLYPMMHPAVLRRMSNSSLYGNTYTVDELLNDLYDGIFAEDISGEVIMFRKSLQQLFVERLITIYEGKGSYSGIESRSSAFSMLNKIYKKIHKNKKGSESTQNHRALLAHQINGVLKIED